MNSSARWFNSKMQKHGICFFSLLGLVVSLRPLPKPLKRRRLRKPWGLRVLLGIGGGLRGGGEIEVVALFFSHYKSSTSSFTVPDFFQLLFGQYSYTGRIYIRVRNYNGFGFFIIATYNNCMTTV